MTAESGTPVRIAAQCFAAPVLVAVWIAALGVLTPVHAVESAWQSAAGGDWSNDSNWDGGVPNGAGAIAVFPAEAPESDAVISLDLPVTLGSITSQNANTVHIGGPESLAFVADGMTEPQILVRGAKARLLLDVDVEIAATQLSLDISPLSAAVELRGDVGATSASFVKSGLGLLRLAGDNGLWTGPLAILDGTVVMDHPNAIGSGDVPTTLHRGIVTMSEPNAESLVLHGGEIRILEADSSGPILAHQGLVNAVGANLSGPITLQDGRLTIIGSDVDLTSEVSGSGVLNLDSSSGVLRLESRPSHSGMTAVRGHVEVSLTESWSAANELVVDGGRLVFTAPADQPMTVPSLRLARNGTITRANESMNVSVTFDEFSAQSGDVDVPLAGSGVLTKTTPGTVSLQRASPEFTGTIHIEQGTLDLLDAGALGDASAGVSVATGGTLVLRAGAEVKDEPITLRGGTLKAFDPRNDGSLAMSAPMELQGDGVILSSGAIFRVSSPITGDGDLVFADTLADGEGRQSYAEISGDNTFSGDILVDLRNVQSRIGFTSPQSLGSGSRMTISAGTVIIDGGGEGKQIFVDRDAHLVLGDGTYAHDITLAGGTLAGIGSQLSTPLQLRQGGTLGFDSSEGVLVLTGDVLGTGAFRVNLRGVIEARGRFGHQGDIVAEGPLEISGPLENDGRLLVLYDRTTVSDNVSLADREVLLAGHQGSHLAFAGDNVVSRLIVDARGHGREGWRDDFRVIVNEEAALTIEDELRFLGGVLDGRFLGQPVLTKGTRMWGSLKDIAGSDFERVEFSEGTLYVTGSLGEEPPEFHVGPSYSARLELTDVGRFAGDIFLNSHPGQALTGSLHTSGNTVLGGNLYLRDDGYVDQAEISGQVHGGSLVSVGYSGIVLRSGGHTFTGPTVLARGQVRLVDDGALAMTSAIVGPAMERGELVLDNSGTRAVADRLADAIPIRFRGNTLTLIGREGEGVAETVGPLTLEAGFNEVRVDGGSGADSTALHLSSLQRQPRSTVRFTTAGDGAELHLASPPVLNDGLLAPWATFGDRDFATYGPNGITAYETLHSYIFELAEAGPNVNVTLDGEHPRLADDVTVNSLRLRNTRLPIGTSTLTVDSGAILASGGQIILQGGRLTAGDEADGELVLHVVSASLELDTRIVDGADGPLNLTVSGDSGGVILRRGNGYTGDTTINGSAQLQLDVVNAIPREGTVSVDGGHLWINYPGAASITMDRLVLTQGGDVEALIENTPPIDAAEYDVQHGRIGAELVGTGTMTKTGLGGVSLTNSRPEYSGKIIVREGTLYAGGPDSLGRGDATDDESIFVERRGVLLVDAVNDPLPGRRLVLEGGRLEGGWAGPIEVRDDSLIGSTTHLGGLISGDLSGAGDLVLDGPFLIEDSHPDRSDRRWLRLTGKLDSFEGNLEIRGGGVLLHGTRGDYDGEIDVYARLLAATGSPDALGKGTVRLHEDGNLMVSTRLNLNVEFAGGGVRFQQIGGDLAGDVSVPDNVRALVYFAEPGGSPTFTRGTFSGNLTLGDGAKLRVSPDTLINFDDNATTHDPKELVLSGRTIVNGAAQITSFDAEVIVLGPVVAGSDAAVLDLVGQDSFDLWHSLELPAGTGLTLLQDGEPLPVSLQTAGQYVRGSGTLHNDLQLGGSTLVSPGDTLGILQIDGDVQFEGGRLLIEIAGAEAGVEHDLFAATGSVVVSGSLELAAIDDFRPLGGDVFRIIVAGESVHGRFTSVAVPVIEESLGWSLLYGASDVSLLVGPHSGDYDGNGLVEQTDLDLVLADWGEVEVPAGWVRDLPRGIIDQSELDHVLAGWGSQVFATPAAVPEPGTAALLVASLAVLIVACRGVRPTRAA